MIVFNVAGYGLNLMMLVRSGESVFDAFSLKDFSIALMPTNYCVILYIAVYCLSLFFDVMMKELRRKDACWKL
ncbi:MAG: hypothetical protein E7265_00720 [Lachnospiraceae bacterium]|nr:hypothetical protein [Lachnospiraceae bacterium]